MYVEPGADGTIPEHPDNTSRAWLQTIGNRLVDCETSWDIDSLNDARKLASRALEQAVKHALDRGGMELVAEPSCDFRHGRRRCGGTPVTELDGRWLCEGDRTEVEASRRKHLQRRVAIKPKEA